ncbi:MAG: hypothetical protein ABIV25_07985 [Paracoccaceae bacterium]
MDQDWTSTFGSEPRLGSQYGTDGNYNAFSLAWKMRNVMQSNLLEFLRGDLYQDDLIYLEIYSADLQKIGSVSHCRGTPDGEFLIIDVGGYLTVQPQRIILPSDQMKFMRDQDGVLCVFAPLSKTQARALADLRSGLTTKASGRFYQFFQPIWTLLLLARIFRGASPQP